MVNAVLPLLSGKARLLVSVSKMLEAVFRRFFACESCWYSSVSERRLVHVLSYFSFFFKRSKGDVKHFSGVSLRRS